VKNLRIIALALTWALAGCGPNTGADQATELAEVVDAWRERTPVPGVVMAVSGAGFGEQIVASGTLTRGGSEPVKTNTQFRVGSVTKTVLASVVLQLVEEGRVALDDPVLGVRPVSDPQLAGLLENVTVRDLLGHTSGLPDSARSPELIGMLQSDPDHVWTDDQVLALVSRSQREFVPRTAFGYSNTNYVVLGNVIEELTGRPWWAEARSRVLDPLDMNDSYMAGFEPATGSPAPGYFDTDNDGFTEELASTWPALETSEGAAGALVSTVPDLLSFARGLFGAELISETALDEMTTPGPFATRYTGYGLGIEITTPDLETTVWGHGGFVPGYRAILWHAPVPDLTIVVLTNESRSRPDGLAELALGIATG
jgi:D-alanyl-D-alanine carboxypeptidase